MVELFAKWGVLKEALDSLVRRWFVSEDVILGHIFVTVLCVIQPFLWVTPESKAFIQTVRLFVIVPLCAPDAALCDCNG